MKWKAGREGKQRWFAWHPVYAGGYWVWLEWVDREVISSEIDPHSWLRSRARHNYTCYFKAGEKR